MDPFETLGIPRSFDVDLAAVERAHRDLSRALHPDRFVGASPSERRAALTKAVAVNEAWRVVRDPIRRAEALLGLAGGAPGEGAEPVADPELLMDMLEQREALADARRARDLVAVRALARTIEERARGVERAVGEAFGRGEAERHPEGIARKLGELRFYRRFLDEVSAIEDELAA
ncbi:MAG TPA: Fe-S protein assembly co-chaperone HscB [Polyangiaceae bacterium]|nr:Fe-S protein assembly co-chaperone HscB [Polyangiaceae bacterium]